MGGRPGLEKSIVVGVTISQGAKTVLKIFDKFLPSRQHWSFRRRVLPIVCTEPIEELEAAWRHKKYDCMIRVEVIGSVSY